MSETRKLSQQETRVCGTAWSTAGNFISRLIGALYIIPWYAWMGKNGAEANALFGMGYEIYAMFLSISTVGIPVAVAKLVSKYNTLGQSETSIYMVKKILHIMALLGAIFAAIMYIGAPFFCFAQSRWRRFGAGVEEFDLGGSGFSIHECPAGVFSRV